jgi:hypothetical protein
LRGQLIIVVFDEHARADGVGLSRKDFLRHHLRPEVSTTRCIGLWRPSIACALSMVYGRRCLGLEVMVVLSQAGLARAGLVWIRLQGDCLIACTFARSSVASYPFGDTFDVDDESN